ncbi:molybdenum cofactor synthesis domain-containing protein [Hyphobacterium sp. HN65]|uniref:Molybdenum cofactor biosynthesis protein B n=1 Tax=Hyphobacterium lacteum TaxID=3116575 RepID=A0ABU7LQ21_9PROT|nr:molybdenum cofactor synthesis domain-containing protein [Hyphobacterium sp. HN65]MEE2525699.1 molybdenum cofactor synthesis domain-containing protein [Hyphobacterium sp. HN65]
MTTIPETIGFAVMTVSDTRDDRTDKTGPWLREQIVAEGHAVIDHAIVHDEIPDIQAKLKAWIAEPGIHAIIATGGTGLTGRDVTPEAMRPLFDKEMDGFAAVFHQVSFKAVGVSTIQSRAIAGIAGGTYVFAIPGSSGGCRDAWNHILRDEFDRTHRPCNLVDLLPRLTER